MTTQSQESRILAYLKSGRSLTPLEALRKFGCFRLGARIWNLRHSRYWRSRFKGKIKSERVYRKRKVFARYSLA